MMIKNKISICKCFLLILFLNCCLVEAFSQENNTVQAIDNEYYKQVNPEAWCFHQYSYSALNHNNGKANVEIPIYEINIGRISVPIKLAYNTTGIKVEQPSSYVGTGWDLVANGRITRRIMGGLMDLYEYKVGQTDTKKLGYQKKGNYDYNVSYFIDQAPDLFYSSAPGLSANFFFSKNGGLNCLNDKNILVEKDIVEDLYFMSYNSGSLNYYHDDYVKFTITNDQGLEYVFDEYEIGGTTSSNWNIIHNVSTWYLTEIHDPLTGEKVTFEYDDIGTVSREQIVGEQNENITGCGCNAGYVSNNTSFNYHVQRLSRIVWDEGVVEFAYNTSRTDSDASNDKALSSINVYNNSGFVIKDYDLEHSYFTSVGGSSASYYRLKLNKVVEYSNDRSDFNEYQFDYYSGNLPHKRSKEQDLWGYYNDNNAYSLLPKLYFYPDYAPSLSSSVVSKCFFPEALTNTTYTAYIINGADRSVNEDAIKVGMLKRINLPTGGYKEFGYESNEISIGNSTIKGGGLRLAFERLNDTSDSYLKTYEYESGEVLAIPQMAHMCDPNTFAATSSSSGRLALINDNLKVNAYSFVNSFDLNPYEVLYRKVTEKQEGNGSVVYNFNPLANDYSFVDWRLGNAGDDGCSYMLKVYSSKHFTLPPRTSLSGKPYSTLYYREGDVNALKEINYNYINSISDLLSEDIQTKIGYFDQSYYFQDVDYKYRKALLLSKTETIDGVSQTINFTYDNEIVEYQENTDLLRSISKEIDDGGYETTIFTYPFDLIDLRNPLNTNNPDYLGYKSLVEKNVNIPVYSEVFVKQGTSESRYVKEFVLNLYKSFGTHIYPYKSLISKIPKLSNSYDLQFNSLGELNALSSNYFEVQNEIIEYSNNKPSLIYDHKSGVYSFMNWDDDDTSQPLIVAYNATDTDVIYESFELEGSYPQSQFRGMTTGGVVGDYCLDPYSDGSNWLIKKSFDPSKTYRISFWAKGNGVINIHNSNYVNISGSDWKYYTKTFTGESQLEIIADMQGLIDEIKIYPVDGKMLTRTHIPLVGVTSETNENELTTYYKYDDFWRLKTIKDHDKNILQHFEYNYVGAVSTEATSIGVSKSSITFPSIGLAKFVNITSNGPWTVTKPSWIIMDVPSGDGNATVEITALPNRGTATRLGEIVFSIPGKSVKIYVTQLGKDFGGGGLEPIKEDLQPQY
nr:BACON domain-containing protein [uncultured Marinifilum sp.]